MNDVNTFIESGILEMYVLGQCSVAEQEQVEHMAAMHSEVRDEIEAIGIALESYARTHAMEPEDPTIKTFLMATINYMERMKKGEQPGKPPMLGLGSKIEDYEEWLKREDLQLTEPLQDAYARIIGYSPEVTTAIVWLKYGAPPETHSTEQEKFLIVEGSCEITIGNDVHSMAAGDVLIIPLHISHHVKVTSEEPCKIILQRVAA